jgi:hypothetical protein
VRSTITADGSRLIAIPLDARQAAATTPTPGPQPIIKTLASGLGLTKSTAAFSMSALPVAITVAMIRPPQPSHGNDFYDPNLDKWFGVTDAQVDHTGRLRTLNTPLMFDPGTKWSYGIGIDWAGIILERVTKSRLGDYFSEHLFEPLGMMDTGFTCTPDMLERKAA